jgi:DNA-binding CsgD family transcriptional regulator
MPDVDVLRMIERIYDVASDPAALGELAPNIAREFAGDFSILYVVQGTNARTSSDLLLSATPNFDDWAHSSYTGYYRARDMWALEIVRKANAGVVRGLDAVDKRELMRSEVYADWYRKVGVFHTLMGVFPVNGEMGVAAVSRPDRRKEFDEREKRHFSLLIPHLQRAVQINQRLSQAEQERALTFEMLERLALGIIIVDAEARVLFANSVAHRTLLLARDLTVVQGRLRLRNQLPRRTFEKLLRDAAWTSIGRATSPGGVVAVPRPEGLPLSLLVSPYRAPRSSDPQLYGAALVVFSDPENETELPEQAIAKMLGLSPAEGRLVTALVSGQSITEYAASVGISKNTAKTQMRQIFNKTGYNRYFDIVRAVAANPLVKLIDPAG